MHDESLEKRDSPNGKSYPSGNRARVTKLIFRELAPERGSEPSSALASITGHNTEQYELAVCEFCGFVMELVQLPTQAQSTAVESSTRKLESFDPAAEPNRNTACGCGRGTLRIIEHRESPGCQNAKRE